MTFYVDSFYKEPMSCIILDEEHYTDGTMRYIVELCSTGNCTKALPTQIFEDHNAAKARLKTLLDHRQAVRDRKRSRPKH